MAECHSCSVVSCATVVAAPRSQGKPRRRPNRVAFELEPKTLRCVVLGQELPGKLQAETQAKGRKSLAALWAACGVGA
jgi:hypothetical protein